MATGGDPDPTASVPPTEPSCVNDDNEDGNNTEDTKSPRKQSSGACSGLETDSNDEREKEEVEERKRKRKREEEEEIDEKREEEAVEMEEEKEEDKKEGEDVDKKGVVDGNAKIGEVQTPPKIDAKKKEVLKEEAQKHNAVSEMGDSPTRQREYLAEQLRRVLGEQLKAAVANGDYEGAATIQKQISGLPPPPPDTATPKLRKRRLEAAADGEVELPSQKRQRLEEQLEAAVTNQDYIAAATLKQQLGELPPVTTIAEVPAPDRQRLEEQLKAVVAKADYIAAAKLKQQIEALSPASGQAASTTVNDHARERQHLEEQLKAALAKSDYTAAAKLKQQIEALSPASATEVFTPRKRQRLEVERQGLEEQLREALHKTDYTAAAAIQQQINDLSVAASAAPSRDDLRLKIQTLVPPALNG